MSLQAILDDCGLNITHYDTVHGGDINSSYCLHSTAGKYFLKVNDNGRYPGMFEKEANGLQALANGRGTFIIPKVARHRVVQQQQYLLLEWIAPGKPKKDFWESFGAALATMHQQPQLYFGWDENNYIGSLVQKNTKHDTWHSFYSECRILPLVEILFNTGAFTKDDVAASESFCKKARQLFPVEAPSLLHGDLWSGNFMIAASGDAAIYDPAVYFGHREMDIGMTKLFGGFNQRFYDGYNETYPLQKDWLQRLPLSQLYPLLVHAVLFRGHYTGSARNIIYQFQ